MVGMEDLIELLEAGLVILVISVVITLSWMSTYVREQPVNRSTTVLLVREEPISSTSRPNVPSSNSNHRDLASNPPSESRNERNTSSEEQIADPSTSSDSNLNDVIEASSEISESNVAVNDKNLNIKTDSQCKSSDGTEIPSCSDNSTTKVENKDVRKKVSSKNSSAKLNNNSTNNRQDELPAVEDSIRIRLKFLDDTQRHVRGKLTELVGNFKRTHFQIELSSNCAVRLIFNGQLMNRDSSSLAQYGLFDNCVVHCYVGQPQSEAPRETTSNVANAETDDIDLSEILSPLLLIVVAFLWYLRYEYANIFNTSATIILVCLTALLLVSQYALTITFNISLGFNSNTTTDTNPNNPEESTSAENVTPSENSDSTSPTTSSSTTNTSNSSHSEDTNETSDSRSQDQFTSNSIIRNVKLDSKPILPTDSHQVLPNRTIVVS